MPHVKHFPLPDVGEGLTEAEILRWRVSPGETVTLNQEIVEVETAKAAVELPCPFEGEVTELLAEEGQTVRVGTPIIAISVDSSSAAAEAASDSGDAEGGGSSDAGAEEVANLVGYGPRSSSSKRRRRKNAVPAQASAATAREAVRAPVRPEPAAAEAPAPETTETATSGAAEPAAPSTEPAGTVSSVEGGYVALAKPPVRKLAKDLGIDLRELTGTGPGGVVTREDVERASEPATVERETVPEPGARERRVPIKGVRKATAQAMVDSAFTAPHVTEFFTIDVTPMMEFRERLKSHPEFRDVKITPLAFAAKAVCLAARRTPDVNATWDKEAGEIVYKDYVHLGIAAATPRGLIVPKIRDADQMSLRALAESLASLTENARDGNTAPADLINGTITITNVGVFGVDSGTPILNPGEAAILAVGAVRDMPWVVDGQVVPRKVCQLAVSFDHRIVDGVQGSRFLADVGALMSDPSMAMTY